ncbi:contractile injection system tape measure protein [Kordia jejudonensis]|uniref:contractile injection system tape measure protein n=1 Tax=Kordia jejudonensis TaxID=1348245 RepID=UPI000629CCC0|nr:contractile injection system tape measure protein [Kordia jejudonensis]
MHSSGAHIVTRCEWNTAFDSKDLATTLQTYISKWSTYKMQRIINSVFDRFCPEGQTMKIKKLSLDLGAITYENMERELPIRLKSALYDALFALIMYPKSGDQTLEVVNASMAQLSIIKAFLLEGMLPWNYQESYGSANQIMRLQLTNNRLEIIQLIQKIGQNANVRKRIAWQFDEKIIKKIITGLEPNNHQQIISFSEEFVKIQEKENVLKTSTQAFKKNLWLWILNYLFVDRGTIFNKIAFVRSTITQIANHFNISYDILVELIEAAINKNKKYTIVNTDFIAILRLLSNELHHKAYTEVNTLQQQENFWRKVVRYFNNASARSTSTQKNEFNELVINLSKLDAKRFQKIIISVEQKPTHWEAILKDLIPAAIENLFIALSPSQSKNILTQIEFLTQLQTEISTKIAPVKLYTLGIEFCVKHQNASVSKHDFLTFVIEKIAKKQQQSKFSILHQLIGTAITSTTTQKTVFIPLFNELKSLFQQEIVSATVTTTEKLDTIIEDYIEAITTGQISTNETHTLEQKIIQWIGIAPKDFWNIATKAPKNVLVTKHISALIASYGTQRFITKVQPTIASFVQQLQRILSDVSSKNPKQAATIRVIKHVLFEISFAILWKENIQQIDRFFVKLLVYIQREKAVQHTTDVQEVIQLLLQHPNMRTIGFSSQELVTIQQQFHTLSKKTILTRILEATQEINQQEKVAELVTEVVRSKKIYHATYQKHTDVIVSYLLPNGMKIRKELLATYIAKITKANPNFSNIKIEKTLNDCFWQTLLLYVSYRGNAQKFHKLFEETIANTFPEIQIGRNVFRSSEKVQKEAATTTLVARAEVAKNAKRQENFASKLTLKTIEEAIQQQKSAETIAELVAEIIQTKNIQFSDYQTHTKTIIAYLLSNGVHLRTELVATFLTKITKEIPNLSPAEIRQILEINFWKTLVSYTIHKGKEQRFRTLFETNVTNAFSIYKAASVQLVHETKAHDIALTIPIKVTTTVLFETIQQAMQNATTTVIIGKKTYTFSEAFVLGLETSPAFIRRSIQQTVHTKKQRVQLQNAISFEAFIVLIPKGLSNSAIVMYKSFHMLFVIAKHFGNAQITAILETLFWKETIASIQTKIPTQQQLKALIKITFDELSNIETLDLLTIVKYIQRNRLAIPKVLKTALISHHTIFEAIAATNRNVSLSKAIETCVAHKKIDVLSTHLITQFTIPAWFQHTASYTYENILNTLLAEQPLVMLSSIRSSKVSDIQLTKLSQTIQFSTLINTLIKLYPVQRKRLLDIQKLYESMAMISTAGIATKELQDILSKKVWKAWQTSNWSLLTQTNIWNELVWETCGKKNMHTRDFVKAIQSIKTSLPNALQVTFTSLFPDKKKAVQITSVTETKTLKQVSMQTQNTSLPEEGIYIPNAGLVLLNNYFLMLMDRLGIIENNEFKTEEDQENAVHYFQYIVTGLTETEEALLVLNKILAGLSPTTPVKSAIEMTSDQKELIDGLIQAAIGYWPEIGNTSVDGFRGNWLVREGVLRETEERWELTVEKRAYDILMIKAPFSFSIIKLPWMPKPLHVTWPF